MYVTSEHTYDFTKLAEVTKVIVRNLNKIIDINYYPIPEASLSNKRHRPIGIGVQGLADAFILMRYPFESPEAQLLNKQIFETIYYGALKLAVTWPRSMAPMKPMRALQSAKESFSTTCGTLLLQTCGTGSS